MFLKEKLRKNWGKLGLLTLFCLAFFKGCTYDFRKDFPSNFWPSIKGVGVNRCVDLSGKYRVTTYPENEMKKHEYIVQFPPGVSTRDKYEFTVTQSGCERIEIAYTNRFQQQRQYVVDKQQNQLHWQPEQGLFCYKVTAFEPDGFAGVETFNENRACFGVGVDGSFLTDFQMHSAAYLFFLRGELMDNQKYKFEQIHTLKDER